MTTNLLDDAEVGTGENGSRDYHWTLNFGPQHPATHTTLRLVLELDGERVVNATPHIGYLHSGFEKLGEHLNFNQYVTIADRKNYISPPYNEIAWHQAVEKLLGVELTPRGKYVRTIIGELSRISDHLLSTGAVALDLGAFTAFLYAFNQRELIYDVYEEMSGYRFHPGYTRVGGVMSDFNDKVIARIERVLKSLPPMIRDFERLLLRNKIFLERTQGVGVLTREEAINLSCTGPVARASGVFYDIRKDEPYLAYPELDFDVPYATEGDSFARFHVRIEEIRQSIRILEQALAKLPDGPVNAPIAEKLTLPDKATVYNSMEGLIQHFELILPNRGIESPVDEIYSCVEGPNGELGYYLVADGSQTGWRTRTRPPSFIHFAVFPHLIRDHMLSDVVVVLGSLNIIAAELDR